MITSIQNSKVKKVHALQNKQKDRKKEKLFIVEGIKMLTEISVSRIEEIYVSESFLRTNNKVFFDKHNYIEVSDSVFKYMSTFTTPQGILGIIKLEETSLQNISLTDNPIIIILEDIQDPGNLGTIIRTADAILADGIIMSQGCVDLYNPKVIRSTMGSIFRVPIVQNVDIIEYIRLLKQKGIMIYAAHLDAEKYYFDMDYKIATCFLIGNEGNGISQDVSELASMNIKIPMIGKAESLNASVAASVLMYEALSQRMRS